MFTTNIDEPSLRYRLLTSALLFGLLAEWIIPWMNDGEFGGMLQLGPLLVVIGCVLGAGLFRPEWYISLLFNSALCVLSLMWLYKSGDESALEWLNYLPKLLWNDLDQLFAVGLWTMSGEMRTLLLFIGWAMLAPALQALLWMRQLALGFAAITAAYLLLLHTWLGMDVWSSLLRTVVEGLLLGGIVTIARVQRLHGGGRERSGGQTVNWLSISLFIVVLCTGAGILFAGNKPVQQEPAAWTASLSERLGQSIMKLSSNDNASAVLARGTEGASTGETGYGFDDSELGAPLQQSDSVIFTGVSPVRTYWRGESKSVYDGRGWSNEWSDKTLLPVEGFDRSSVMAQEIEDAEGQEQNDLEAEDHTSAETVGTKVIQTVVMKKAVQGMPLFASGPSGRVLNLVAADPRRSLNTYVSNDFSGALYAPTNKAKIERYTVQSTLPITDELKLREVSQKLYGASTGTEGSSEADASGLDKYLQLPESLPSRVAALAAEISGGGVTNRYEQVKAVESYLKNNYTYTIADSKVPPQGTDLVDHFLFEQNKGYCVHFSSAMVVMLRTQGIPARWVKGFAPGTPTESTLAAADDALTAYEVSSKDAHAWVEVYFPEVGWVPFDPTPGFDGVEGAATAALAGAALLGADGVDGSAVVGADARPLGMHAQAMFEAAARESAAFADAALGAAKAAAAAPPAAKAAAGAVALALAAAAVAAAQAPRLRLALALRRYGAAYAAHSSGVEGTRPLAAHGNTRERFAAVSAAMWQLLNRRLSVRPLHQTAREYGDAMAASVSSARGEALRRFIAWDDAAKFGQQGDWIAPEPEELASAVQSLSGSKSK